MSKGNLPQTEAGSSEAVAPGKAELLSFLKCQRGLGRATLLLSALTSCCPKAELSANYRSAQTFQEKVLFSDTKTQIVLM